MARDERDRITVEQWLAIRKEAGLQIDPETAQVEWCNAQTLDPYGVCDLPEEYQQVGREYFARSPQGDVWVWFGDLPEVTQRALWDKHDSNLAFPAGLEGVLAAKLTEGQHHAAIAAVARRSASVAAVVKKPQARSRLTRFRSVDQ